MLLRTSFIFLFAIITAIIGAQDKPPAVPEHIWNQVTPYLLPDDHPAKDTLDILFSSPCLTNGITLYQAGFRFPQSLNPLKVYVAKHPDLKGYVVKLFLENQPNGAEWPHWIQRIEGANLIRETIEQKAYTASFKVPQKWIYFIPLKANQGTGRLFVLIAEDMKLETRTINHNQWKHHITYEQVYMFWDLLETCGLNDSIYIDNVPCSKDGRYAFIDTEHYLNWPIEYEKFNRYLRDGKLELWKQLTNQEYKQSKVKKVSKSPRT